MISSKDFIFNTDLEYPPIIAEGKVTASAFTTVTLKSNMPAGADYHVFGTIINGTYGTGLQKVTCWVDASGNLKANASANGPIYWRVYAY